MVKKFKMDALSGYRKAVISNINAKVREKELTIDQLAELMNYERTLVYRKLTGERNLTIEDLPIWANALGCSVCDLLYDPDSYDTNICTEAEIISNKISSLTPKHKKLIIVIVDLICKLITLSNAENDN